MLFQTDDYHKSHKFFGYGVVHDLGRFYRVGLLWPFFGSFEDHPTFEEAAARLMPLHEDAAQGLVWC